MPNPMTIFLEKQASLFMRVYEGQEVAQYSGEIWFSSAWAPPHQDWLK